MAKKTALKTVPQAENLKLDLGCGKRKKEGFIGVDQHAFEGVDQVVNLKGPWPWGNGSVEEIHMSHCLEHFNGNERVHIFNEMYRVMRIGAKATIMTPYWCSNRAYGDFTHQWPPVSEMLYNYLWKAWRLENAPDNDSSVNPSGYHCDFDYTYGYSVHPTIQAKNQEAQMYALSFYKEAASDLICTITKSR
jgi:hypothetical protein